jgi:hypothetical protein
MCKFSLKYNIKDKNFVIIIQIDIKVEYDYLGKSNVLTKLRNLLSRNILGIGYRAYIIHCCIYSVISYGLK